MKKAYPINEDGQRIGADKEFSDESWDILQSLPNLRWVAVEDVKIAEVPEEDYYVTKTDLSTFTKREIISTYEMDEQDMKLTKDELIKKAQQ